MSGKRRIEEIKRNSMQKDDSFKSSFQSMQLLTAKTDDLLDERNTHTNKFTLRFENESLEKEFRGYYHKESLVKAKYGITMALLVEFISSIFDFLFLLSDPNLPANSSDNLKESWPLVSFTFVIFSDSHIYL